MKVAYGIFALFILSTACTVVSGQVAEGLKFQPVKLVSRESEKRVDVLVGGKPFTSYIFPDVLKKPVLYPVISAGGSVITRGWPMDPRPGERVDHPHHVGVWLNYGDVNGYDFWNNSNAITKDHKGPFGTIRNRKIDKLVSGEKKGELSVTSDWMKDDGTVMLREDTRFTFSGTDSVRIIDRKTTLTALKEAVLFKDNKEGLFALRLARELEHPSDKPEKFTDAAGNITEVPALNNQGVTGLYTSSEEKKGDDVWGTRASWVVLDGKIKNEPLSVLILDHPRNPGYPSYWHARGYGLFAVNSLGQEAMSNGKESLNFSLAPGKSVTFNYRIVVYSGGHLSKERIIKDFSRF